MIYTWTEVQQVLPGYAVNVYQRLGFYTGKPLKIDNDAGHKTRNAEFYVPDITIPHLQIAFNELLNEAQEYPLGRNAGPDVAKYYNKPELVEVVHGAWCAAYAGWCLRTAYGKMAPYSWSARRLFKRACSWEWGEKVSISNIPLGSLLVWSRDSAGPYFGHTGFKIGEDATYVYAIEGNNGPFVRIFRYRKDLNLANSTDPCIGACSIFFF